MIATDDSFGYLATRVNNIPLYEEVYIMAFIKTVLTSILLSIASMFGVWLWNEVLENMMNNVKNHIINKQKVRAA